MASNPTALCMALRSGAVILALAASLVALTKALSALPASAAPATHVSLERGSAEPTPGLLRGRFWRPEGTDARRPSPSLMPSRWEPSR